MKKINVLKWLFENTHFKMIFKNTYLNDFWKCTFKRNFGKNEIFNKTLNSFRKIQESFPSQIEPTRIKWTHSHKYDTKHTLIGTELLEYTRNTTSLKFEKRLGKLIVIHGSRGCLTLFLHLSKPLETLRISIGDQFNGVAF